MSAIASHPKKAIIYYGGFKSRSGGAYMHALLLCQALAVIGWEAQLITLDSLPEVVKYIPHVAFKVGNLLASPSGFFLKGKLISLLYRLFCPASQASVVVFEDIYLAWRSPLPSIAILHAVWSDNLEGLLFSLSAVEKLKSREVSRLRSFDCPVATVSPEYRSFLVDHHFNGFDLPDLFCIPLGVDLPHIATYRKLHSCKNPHSLVFCGVCVERKNLFFLLDVLEGLIAVDHLFSLTIIGDGPLLSSLQASAQKRSLPVFFKGRLPREALLEEFSLHSVCVHPSTKESFSFALLEAKVLGLSTVAYCDLEVPSEFVDVPVPSFDANSWITAIINATARRAEPDLSMYSSVTMAEQVVRLAFAG